MLEPVQYLLGAGSGALVGFVLGLVGGGGSILAVPLMIYLVGVPSPHLAIGTSAFAVAANAALSLVSHARAGAVRWRCATMFAAAGIAGALVGSTAGKAFDGQKLLFLFALVMASPQGLFARQRFLGHKRNMGYATRFNRAIGSLSGWNSPAGSRLACSQR
ncbi:sulfite exporter TauE/SafE family protein [Sphingomonas sp. ABOLD]|uniref:TSUP family transporter n=1 Tax=Sphingomonas sp. ABOLD TaxID=1985877 RepID=UPI0019D1B853|nr:sulfite exporter TauE/SafE family protein [Sphingomonas sp. ABOLD]